MGYIKEPDDIDFIIQSKPLTDKERKEISKFIQDYKAENIARKPIKKLRTPSSKQKLWLDLECTSGLDILP